MQTTGRPHSGWTSERKRVKTLSRTDLTDQQVAEKLAAFEKEQDPTLLYEAMELMEAAERELPSGDTMARKQALARRLRFFAALDRNIDPTWDIKNVPVQGAPPPPSHDGMVYGTGEVDSSAIRDPIERAEYVRALKASKDYAKWYDVQYQLRQIDERAMRIVALLLPGMYSNSAADRREFEDLLAASPVSEPRKDQLRAIMPEPA